MVRRRDATDNGKRGSVCSKKKKKKKTTHISKPCSPEFFTVFLPNSKDLLIPPDYMKHFSRTVQERIILKDLSGRVWHVSVAKTQNGAFIKDGWQSFVDYHRLKVGEFLVFSYDGKFSFIVKVFGTDACKRETCAAQETVKCPKMEENAEEEIEPELRPLKRARPLRGSQELKALK